MYGSTYILYFKIYQYMKQMSKKEENQKKRMKVFVKRKRTRQKKFAITLSPIYEQIF